MGLRDYLIYVFRFFTVEERRESTRLAYPLSTNFVRSGPARKNKSKSGYANE